MIRLRNLNIFPHLIYCTIYLKLFQIKIPKVKIPTHLYYDDTPDPESGLTIEKGHTFRGHEEKMCTPHERFLDPSEEEEIDKGYMMTKDDFEDIKYEDPLVKKLFICQVRHSVVKHKNINASIIQFLKIFHKNGKIKTHKNFLNTKISDNTENFRLLILVEKLVLGILNKNVG